MMALIGNLLGPVEANIQNILSTDCLSKRQHSSSSKSLETKSGGMVLLVISIFNSSKVITLKIIFKNQASNWLSSNIHPHQLMNWNEPNPVLPGGPSF
jgi:hypothetical protein